MLYHTTNPDIKTITGIGLTHLRLSPVERAVLAVDFSAGHLSLREPTIVQSAAIVGSNVVYVRHALRTDDIRTAQPSWPATSHSSSPALSSSSA
jgi:hypothetical protein